MNKIFAFFVAVSLRALQGCSVFRDTTQTVNIQCIEPNTIIMIDGQYKTCPTQLDEKRNRPLYIQAHKPGYVPYGRSIGYHLNATGTLDFVGTILFIVPIVGYLSPGAWDLDETNVIVQLLPNNAVSVPATPQTAPVPTMPEHQ